MNGGRRGARSKHPRVLEPMGHPISMFVSVCVCVSLVSGYNYSYTHPAYICTPKHTQG